MAVQLIFVSQADSYVFCPCKPHETNSFHYFDIPDVLTVHELCVIGRHPDEPSFIRCILIASIAVVNGPVENPLDCVLGVFFLLSKIPRVGMTNHTAHYSLQGA